MRIGRMTMSLALAAVMLLGLAACGAKQETPAQPEAPAPSESVDDGARLNGGLTLNVPAEYAGLVLVDTPQDDPDGVLFNVSEKASVEDAAADGLEDWGAGWIFGIRRVNEDALHELLCWDMSGAEVFAKDAEGNYYVYTHPTDVRLYRKDDKYSEATEQWTRLNDWAWEDARRDFLADNAGLEPFTRGNSMFDMYLARAAYQADADYTVSTLAFGPLVPSGVDAAPYVEQLLAYASCESADLNETPDGQYVVLNFPADEMRFDFFLMEGGENYVRQVDYNGESLMKLSFADGTKASEVMQAWYDALAAANGLGDASLGYTADDLVGRWAEKVAGRGLIEITKAGEGAYSVEITWPSSAAEQAIWTMTAAPEGEGGVLAYTDGRHIIRTYTSETAYTDAEQYTDGSGRFYLNSAFEVMWEDETGHAGDDCVFVNAG